MDILSHIPKATRQQKYLLVAVEYFTKWKEAEVEASITFGEVQKFIWKNIITRNGVPKAMVFNNGRQFDIDKMKDYLYQYDCQAC